MKRLIISLLFLIYAFSFINVQAQAPQKFDYQAIVRDGSGNAIADQNVTLRFSIRDQSASGVIVFQETQNIITNQFGLVTLAVGEGTALINDFFSIDWTTGGKFLQVELDRSGGTNYVELGTTQLISVPYALYANKAGNPGVAGPIGPTGLQGPIGPQGIVGPTGPLLPALDGQTLRYNGTDWIANSFLYNNGSNVGINTNAPIAMLHINNGAFLASGSGGITPISGQGIRMMWVPFKGAFRAGSVDNAQWDDANIGIFSVAFGSNTLASGAYALAWGQSNMTLGDNSVIGGNNNFSWADQSFLFGQGLLNKSYMCNVFGSYNDTSTINNHSLTSHVLNDPLFIVANGMGFGDIARSNALTILKNGNAGFSITAPQSTVEINGSLSLKTRVVNTSGTIDKSDHILLANSANSAFTLQLPLASICIGRVYIIKKIDASGNIVTIGCQGSSNSIDGQSSVNLTTPNAYLQVVSDGATNWYIIND